MEEKSRVTGWNGRRGRGRTRGDSRRAMMEPSVHRDPRIINIDDLRPLFGPDGAPLLRAIAPVYEPAGRSTAFLSLSHPFSLSLFLSFRAPLVCVAADRVLVRSTTPNVFSVTRDVTV